MMKRCQVCYKPCWWKPWKNGDMLCLRCVHWADDQGVYVDERPEYELGWRGWR